MGKQKQERKEVKMARKRLNRAERKEASPSPVSPASSVPLLPVSASPSSAIHIPREYSLSENCLGAISRPSSFDLPSSHHGSYALFQNAFNPSKDFTRDNNFRDDPTHFNEGSLVGPDGVHMQIAPVDDEKVRNDISESVLSRVCFTAVFDTLPCCAAGGSAISLGGPGAYFAADSGTRYTIMTMATAQD